MTQKLFHSSVQCVFITDDSIFSHSYLQRVASERTKKRLQIRTSASIDMSYPVSPQHSPTHQQPCRITVLLIVMHAGSVLGKSLTSPPGWQFFPDNKDTFFHRRECRFGREKVGHNDVSGRFRVCDEAALPDNGGPCRDQVRPVSVDMHRGTWHFVQVRRTKMCPKKWVILLGWSSGPSETFQEFY